jgi:hypothetical protein
MKKRVFQIILLCMATVGQAGFGELSNEQIAVSFSSLYPTSPFKKVKVLATQLWNRVDEGFEDIVARDTFENSIVTFTHTVLDLNTLSDLFIKDVHAQSRSTTNRYQHKSAQKTLEEVEYLKNLIDSLKNSFDQIMDGHVSDQAVCVKVVLDSIKKKMERILLSAP